MPTKYQATGNAIERAGPCERGLFFRPIAYCDSDRTASLLVKALDALTDLAVNDDFPEAGRVISVLAELGML